MQLSPYELSLIGGGFTLLGALIGALATYRFALHLARTNARREAGRRLREAFAPELAALHPTAGNQNVDVEKFLLSVFPKHHAAILEFAFHLLPKEQVLFEHTWREYYEVGGSVRFFDYYMGERPRDLFHERVNAILRFTEI